LARAKSSAASILSVKYFELFPLRSDAEKKKKKNNNNNKNKNKKERK